MPQRLTGQSSDPGWPRTADAATRQRRRGALVFDPALKQCPIALRSSDPKLEPERLRAWRTARSAAHDHLLRVIAGSPWRDHLVLRGSIAMRAWLGDAAREPRDIDWMVRPPSVPPDGPWSKDLFSDLVDRLLAQPQAGVALLAVRDYTREDIWTYERAEGRRLAIPWSTADGLTGQVQMDVVFHEELPEPPRDLTVPLANGDIVLPAAGRTLSLAWKLLWLVGDNLPQGKDLYDAVLLVEDLVRTPEPGSNLTHLLAHLEVSVFPNLSRVDWDNFRIEYPGVGADAEPWRTRLETAIGRLVPGWPPRP